MDLICSEVIFLLRIVLLVKKKTYVYVKGFIANSVGKLFTRFPGVAKSNVSFFKNKTKHVFTNCLSYKAL